jgi:hypothetical protein
MSPRIRHALGAVLIVAATALLSAGQASAATARAERDSLIYTAAPGEANAVTWDADGLLHDAGAAVEAGPGCAATPDPHTVDCGRPAFAVVILGDGPDRLDASTGTVPATLSADGGEGDDFLSGGPEADSLRGGPGADTASGGPGDDSLEAGDDWRTIGGHRIVEPASDRLDGGLGNDSLAGRHGADRLTAGPGDDLLTTTDAGGVNHSPIIPLAQDDAVDCGEGVDTLNADYGDGYGASCEFVGDGTPRWRPVRIGSRPRIALKVRCAWDTELPCRGTVRVRKAVHVQPTTWAAGLAASGSDPPATCPAAGQGQLLAHARFDQRAGRVGRVTIPMPVGARARALLGRRACIPVLVTFAFGDGAERHQATRSLRLIGGGG